MIDDEFNDGKKSEEMEIEDNQNNQNNRNLWYNHNMDDGFER
jgi:hypothetical protein